MTDGLNSGETFVGANRRLVRTGLMVCTIGLVLGEAGGVDLWALTLTAPQPDAVLPSGGATPVMVEVGKDVNLR